MTKKQILLNAFNMNCVGHINHGLWTHPRDTSTAYKTLDYWTHLARLLGAACSMACSWPTSSACTTCTRTRPT